MLEHDVVYILKQNVRSAELRYSLRSVEKNFPHRRVLFFCGCPTGIRPDKLVAFHQQGDTPWEKVRNSIRLVCLTRDVSDDFWLFNDDFFIMQPIEKPFVYRNTCDLYERVRRAGESEWADNLRRAADALAAKGYGTDDYALHLPILINKEKALETISAFHAYPMFRSLYGNMHAIGGQRRGDCKIQKMDVAPTGNERFLSTSDESFKSGAVGEYIRQQFPDACKWEK